jgi:chromosome segregation protein
MYLKRLDAHGFKSFAHRISFDFQPGINGIVGPNGCGKSNVVDGIKWCLGEMSTKSLRSEEMLDVIFKGAAGVAPMGFAEVGLVFDNSDRRLPIEFDEVVITRRIHRTGETEYLLNKAPCRLKDIKELFYGTGVGRECYSVISQGQISRIVDATPRERRSIFEEAAGISKYRAQKREAELKMERVGQDLQILDAQVQEIAREIRSLKIQAGKAERYRQLELEGVGKRKALGLYEYHGISQDLAAIRGRLAALEADRATALQALEAARAAASAAEAEARDREAALAQLQAEQLGAVQQAAALEEGLKHSQARHVDLEAERDRIAGDRERQAGERRQAEERLARARADAGQAEAAAAAARERLAEADQMLAQADAACAEIRAAIERLQAEALEAGRKRSQHRNEFVECQAARNGVAAQRARADETQGRLEADFTAVRQANDALAAELGQRQSVLDEVKTAAVQEEARESVLRAELEALVADRRRLAEARERALSREELLHGLEARLEGLGTGAKALLRSPGHGGGTFPGICATVADLLRVEPGCVRAVENLLGERAGWLVAENAALALEAVEHVRAQGLHWVGVIPRNVQAGEPPRLPPEVARRFAPSPAPVAPPSPAVTAPTEASADPGLEQISEQLLEGVVRQLLDQVAGASAEPVAPAPEAIPAAPAVDPDALPFSVRPIEACVQTDPENAAVARWCFRGYWVVPDRDAAIAFLRIAPPGTGAVTLDGLVFGPEGTVGGGAQEGAVSILSRRAELASLAQELAAVTGELEAKAARAAQVEAALGLASGALKAHRERGYEISLDFRDIQARLDGGRKSEELLVREIEVSRRDREGLTAQDGFLAEKEQALRKVLDEVDVLERSLTGTVQARLAEQGRYEASREEIRARVADFRVDQSAAESARVAASEAVTRQEEALAASVAAAGRLDAQAADAARRLEECAADLEARRRALDEANAARERLEARLREAAAERDAVLARAHAEKEKEAVAAARDRELESAIGEQRLQENDRVLRLENLVNAAQAECRLDLAQEYAAGYQPPEGFDAAALKEEVAEIRRRLDAMGAVNLAAIGDLKDREERHAQLAAQEQDLVAGRQKLDELIRRINRESREMFSRTLEQVRENFRTIFRRLFGGGSADIILEEGVDLLEAGIDITAKPPQKDFTNLHLLSGGEKTLTTLALVMSIFKTSPSPFCLLDEADAALDEKNVDRYVGLIREYAQSTQFLVITHNKRTMTSAHVLYGVTMQTPGVSKRVTVNLEQIRSEGGEVKILGGTEGPAEPVASAPAPAPDPAAVPVLAGAGGGGGGGGK